jgi:hypothetical protein
MPVNKMFPLKFLSFDVEHNYYPVFSGAIITQSTPKPILNNDKQNSSSKPYAGTRNWVFPRASVMQAKVCPDKADRSVGEGQREDSWYRYCPAVQWK